MTNISTETDAETVLLSPNNLLAEAVSDALVEAGLISNNNSSELLNKLKTDGVQQKEWSYWINLAFSQQSLVKDANSE